MTALIHLSSNHLIRVLPLNSLTAALIFSLTFGGGIQTDGGMSNISKKIADSEYLNHSVKTWMPWF